MEKQNVEIIGLGTKESQDRTTYKQNVIYVENGRESSRVLYISKWRYDEFETNDGIRDFLLNTLIKQLKEEWKRIKH